MNPKLEITVTGRHLELTDAIHVRVNELAEKLAVHDDKIESIRVELGMERHATSHEDEFYAKAIVDEKKEHFAASSKGDDLYAAIADLGQKLDRLVRNKSRRRVTERRHIKGIDLNVGIPKLEF